MSRVNPWKITGYKAGQNVVCKVSHAEPGGYAVIIPKDNLPGFLPTEQPLKAGEEVLAQYVCVSNSRILLQCRFGSGTKPGAPRHDTVKWEEQLDQINSPAGAKIDYNRPSDNGAVLPVLGQGGYQDNYQQAAQEFDAESTQQVDYQSEQYQYANDQYAENYGEQQPAQGQYDQTQYDQSQYDQTQYDQNQNNQNQYDQGQYAQPQTGQQGYDNTQTQPSGFAAAAPQGYQTGGYSPAQDYSQNAHNQQNPQNAGADPNQAFGNQNASAQPDFGQPQNGQFSPPVANGLNQPGVPVGSFGSQQNGGMQFKPSLPSDYADTQTPWTAAPNAPGMPPAQNNNAAGFGQSPGQTYQAPMQAQAAAQYQGTQQSGPVSYQGPNTESARPYQPQVQAPGPGGFQPAPGTQAVPSQNQYDGGAQAAAQQPAYQSPGSYQGPSQAQALPPYAPVIVPDEKSAKSPEILPSDDWGYSGQGWEAEARLSPAVLEPSAAVPIEIPASEADAAFRVWAPHVQTRDFHLKRATDLVPPAFDEESQATFTSEEQDIEWLITDIEGGMRTGCVKAISQSAMSRSAALLYKGRAVGCIYGRKQQSENYGTEQSLQIMLQDLEKPDTAIQLYDLPESIVLPMSALFLGYPVPREENVDARTYMDYMCNWFESKSQTACLAITFPSRSATSLCFIHEGKFCGAFYVEEQKFSEDKEFVYSLMQSDPQASVEANILPPEMTSSAVRFGFNLSMARKKGY